MTEPTSSAPGAGATITLDRETAHILKWVMHNLDRSTFSVAAEDHKSIHRIRSDELRDRLAAALKAAAAPRPAEEGGTLEFFGTSNAGPDFDWSSIPDVEPQ